MSPRKSSIEEDDLAGSSDKSSLQVSQHYHGQQEGTYLHTEDDEVV